MRMRGEVERQRYVQLGSVLEPAKLTPYQHNITHPAKKRRLVINDVLSIKIYVSP